VKIPSECKVELAASDDKTRSCLTEPYLCFDSSNPVVVATDGRIMAIVPAEVSPTEDSSGWVSEGALKAARKSNNEIICNYSLKVTNGPTFPRPNLGQFLNWKMVVPSNDRPVKFTAKFDAELLWNLARAIGTKHVQLDFGEDGDPILVKPVSSEKHPAASPEAKGLLMPLKG
jgi:hypothetical protein